jgi:arsenite-transporting ATPase
MKENHSVRIILYTGKGGVGKTTVAAATGLRTQELGLKTLVLSVDPAHSLSDVFDRTLGPEPVKIFDNLYAQEIDVYYSIEKYWGNLKEYLRSLLRWQGVDEILAEELSVLPGMEEGAGFLWVYHFVESGDFEVIIIDSAPTGETLRFLALPDIGKWWMDKIFPIQRRMVKLFGPPVKAITDMPIPEDETYEAAEELFRRLEKIHQILTDPNISSVRIVVNPEKMVLKEAQRAFTYLNLYNYPVDLIILNRVLPDKVKSTYFDSWRRLQKIYREMVEEAFSPLPILEAPFMEEEVVGVEKLKRFSKLLFKDKDPSRVFHREKITSIEPKDGGYILSLTLPFAKKEEVSILQIGDEVVLNVGKWRRSIFLPHFLAGMVAESAKLEGRKLKIHFRR